MGGVYRHQRAAAFIERASRLHNYKYDYSQIQYKNKRLSVVIICPIHGKFRQTPETHLRPKRRVKNEWMGCPSCGLDERLERSNKRTKRLCQFCGEWSKYSTTRVPCCKKPACIRKHQLSTGKITGDLWLDAMVDVGYRIARTARENYRKRDDPWDVWFNKKARCINTGAALRCGNMQSKIETITREDLKALAERQQFRCALTGVELTPTETSADHIQAVSRGGEHTIDNIQLVTKQANRLKGTLTNEELLQLARDIVSTLG